MNTTVEFGFYHYLKVFSLFQSFGICRRNTIRFCLLPTWFEFGGVRTMEKINTAFMLLRKSHNPIHEYVYRINFMLRSSS